MFNLIFFNYRRSFYVNADYSAVSDSKQRINLNI